MPPLPTNQIQVRPGFILRVLLGLILFPASLYGLLLILQGYSAWQAASTLDKLQSLRLGDPAAAFTDAVSTWQSDGDRHFSLLPIPYRADWYGWLYNHISSRSAERVSHLSNFLRLRNWRLHTSAEFESGRIASLSATLLLFNPEESVGGGWTLAPSMNEPFIPPATDPNTPTFVNWFHITSSVEGYGYRVSTTPRSSADDLKARHIDCACLLPFHRCRTPLQLLPNVTPLLEKQKLALDR